MLNIKRTPRNGLQMGVAKRQKDSVKRMVDTHRKKEIVLLR